MTLLSALAQRALLMAILLLSLAGIASPVAAQYACPAGPGSGEVQVGSTQGGPGIASMPLCQEQGGSSSSSSVETAQEWADGVSSWSQSIRSHLRWLAENPQPPRDVWTIYPPENDVCSATFIGDSRAHAIIRLPRTAAAKVRPTLTFWSVDGPNTSRKVRALDIAFENGPTGGETVTQTIKVWQNPSGDFILTLPSNAVALRGIEDRMVFKLSLAGKTVVDLNWIDGNRAKAKLAQCLGAR